jgi:UDP-N-acetylmuramoyl-L-alanyl-D-glutamate--2,6-diaminopimelate ligase
MRRVRDGGVVARVGDASRRPDGVLGRRLHESDAGSSGLSRRHGVLLPGQASVVRDVARRGAGIGERRRSSRGRARRGLSPADARTPRGAVHVRSSLVGRPNVYNILAAVATATALDLPFDAIEHGVARLEGVPGRFEIVATTADDVTVIVDYAHTDDALRNLLETARSLASGRIVTVFGCGGDRDRTKRPLMGAVAGRSSDLVFITSDNPRNEDPERIIEEVLRGITADTRREPRQGVFTMPDRRAAIQQAIAVARPGDMVLIAGKGHEKYQLLGTDVLPFDDVAVARDAIGRRRSNSGVV